jgi:hypothetical protein
MKSKGLQAHELREIAAAAKCDPRSVQRYASGELTRGVVASRIAMACNQLGHSHLVRNTPESLAISSTPKTQA